MLGLKLKDGITKELVVREGVEGFFDNEGFHYTKIVRVPKDTEIVIYE